jgi:transcriptional regulator with XRE-family HTH domain
MLCVDTVSSAQFAQSKGKKMLTLDKIMGLLKDRRLDIVSDATGVHRNTLSGIRAGKIKNPSYETVKRLSEYFHEQL